MHLSLYRNYTCVRNICWSNDATNLFEIREFGRKTAMHAEDLFINDGSDG